MAHTMTDASPNAALDRVRAAFPAYVDQLAPAFRTFPWASRGAYAQWLAQTYFYTRHTSRLIALAASRFDTDHQDAHYGLLAHLKEEHRHEELAIADLSHLGVTSLDGFKLRSN